MIVQLVRECPPGLGGVERVAHELASEWQDKGFMSSVVSLRPNQPWVDDPSLPVSYRRIYLHCFGIGRHFLLPLPSLLLWEVLRSSEVLHVHLPCPALLAISVLARLLQPRRIIHLHWHAFLRPHSRPSGLLISLYQWLALRWACFGAQLVVTTSPVLADALAQEGIKYQKLFILPCCLGEKQEQLFAQVSSKRCQRALDLQKSPLRLLFIGRLDSYKRVDWLIDACALVANTELHVIGDGPQRDVLELRAQANGADHRVFFYGRISEAQKAILLQDSDLLVLPSDRCNEAFGIVQLEAMASGIPSLAFDLERSGMAWVCGTGKLLGYTQFKPQALPEFISRLSSDAQLLESLSLFAKERYWSLFARQTWQIQVARLCSYQNL